MELRKTLRVSKKMPRRAPRPMKKRRRCWNPIAQRRYIMAHMPNVWWYVGARKIFALEHSETIRRSWGCGDYTALHWGVKVPSLLAVRKPRKTL